MKKATPPGDQVRVSVHVAVPPGDAFEVFTQEIDSWWKQGPAYRMGGESPGVLHFEPGVGGRLFQTYRVDGETRLFQAGTITTWEPPTLLVFEWRGSNFKPHEKTEVEVRFTPQGDGTLVSVEHRGWSALPEDHPVRHGSLPPDFLRMIGLWWGGLMTSLRHHVGAKSPESLSANE